MSCGRKEAGLPDNDSDMDCTLKDVEETITALDEMPFAEKMGFLAIAAVLMVFSEKPDRQHQERNGCIFTDTAQPTTEKKEETT